MLGQLHGVWDFVKKAVVSNMFCTLFNPLVSISRHFSNEFFLLFLFCSFTIAPSGSVAFHWLQRRSSVSLTTCLLHVLLQLHLAWLQLQTFVSQQSDDIRDFCCGTFVARLCCAAKVARVSYLAAESCNMLKKTKGGGVFWIHCRPVALYCSVIV